jgi:hypothetical protein
MECYSYNHHNDLPHSKTMMKLTPIVCSGAHAVLAVAIFWLAIANPVRSGLLPIYLFFTDFPCSIAMNWLRKSISPSNLWADAAVYVILGSAWWYAIGWFFAVNTTSG